MTGTLTDELPPSARPQTFSGSWDPWFYLHAKEKAKSYPEPNDHQPAVEPPTDYIPIVEYLFRYDRGGFWVGSQAFKYFPFIPFNRLTRWFLNEFMHTRMLYRPLQGINMSFGQMVQDLSLLYGTAERFIDYTAEKLDIWPLWLCPLKGIERPTFHPSYCGPGGDGPPQPMINIGLWGAASEDLETFVRQNRELEGRLTALGGRKVLYSHTYYTDEEFWGLYDRDWYEGLREKYGQRRCQPSMTRCTLMLARPSNTRKRREAGWDGWLGSGLSPAWLVSFQRLGAGIT
jgi:hypothetical protein